MTHVCTPEGLIPIDEYLKGEAEKLQMRAADLKLEVVKTETSTKPKEEPLRELPDDEDHAPPPEGMITLDGFVNFLIANYCPITKYLDCIKDKMHADLKTFLQNMDWECFYKYSYTPGADYDLPNSKEKHAADNLLRILVPMDPPLDYSSDPISPEEWRYDTYYGIGIIANIYEFAATHKFVKASAKP